jgi:hypothetical protein
MMWQATHLVDVVTQDEDAAETTVASSVPMSILRSGIGASQGGGGRSDGGKDNSWTARCAPGVAVEEGVMLVSGSARWLVDLVVENTNPVMAQGQILLCRAVTA